MLHVTPCYYPATIWGGPIFSTKAICDNISDRDEFIVRVLTTDTAGPKRTQNLMLNERTVEFEHGYEVFYGRRLLRNSISTQMLFNLPRQIIWADVIHLTSTYNFPVLPTLALARLMNKPVVWSPRGALQATAQWDEAPNKRLKSALEVVYRLVRSQKTVLHVTAEEERSYSLTRIPGINSVIIKNSVEIPEIDIDKRQWKIGGNVNLTFLSRIHEKKGIERLLTALSELPEHFKLDVYGAGEQRYLNHLRRMVSGLGIKGRVKFLGHVDGQAKTNAFLNADIFVLPTHSENFGIVIAEALAHGVPTITTKNAPWAEIESRESGLWIDDDTQSLVSAIQSLSGKDLEQVGRNGRRWMEQSFSPSIMGDQFAELYKSVTSGYGS